MASDKFLLPTLQLRKFYLQQVAKNALALSFIFDELADLASDEKTIFVSGRLLVVLKEPHEITKIDFDYKLFNHQICEAGRNQKIEVRYSTFSDEHRDFLIKACKKIEECSHIEFARGSRLRNIAEFAKEHLGLQLSFHEE